MWFFGHRLNRGEEFDAFIANASKQKKLASVRLKHHEIMTRNKQTTQGRVTESCRDAACRFGAVKMLTRQVVTKKQNQWSFSGRVCTGVGSKSGPWGPCWHSCLLGKRGGAGDGQPDWKKEEESGSADSPPVEPPGEYALLYGFVQRPHTSLVRALVVFLFRSPAPYAYLRGRKRCEVFSGKCETNIA